MTLVIKLWAFLCIFGPLNKLNPVSMCYRYNRNTA